MWTIESVQVCILPDGQEFFPLKVFNGKMLGKTDLKNKKEQNTYAFMCADRFTVIVYSWRRSLRPQKKVLKMSTEGKWQGGRGWGGTWVGK